MDITKELFSLQDLSLASFNAKIIPNIDKSTIIGVRTAEIRKLAKKVAKNKACEQFLKRLPHKYFEENQLHAFIISDIRDFERAIYELQLFLPYVDNWATCDQMNFFAFKENLPQLEKCAYEWLKSTHTYTVRFGICTLMKYFLDKGFKTQYLDKVAEIKTDEYYINMCSAWFFATALSKQYEKTLPYLKEKKLHLWVHNKTISKACESFRVKSENKNELRQMRCRNTL